MTQKNITTTYYDREMDSNLVSHICKNYPWLIDSVKKYESLDFQTGADPKACRSWFSVYRGTGRILSFLSSRGIVKLECEAAERYRQLMPSSFFTTPTPEAFDEYLQKIESTKELKRYYEGNKGVLKEGYYQTLIGRRYSFNLADDDDFIIMDKEFVLGFKDEGIKEQWNRDIVKSQRDNISILRDRYEGRLPKDIKDSYGEFDFLGLNSSGDILIMELKQDDAQKTALSPIQTAYYYQQFDKLMAEDKDLYSRIRRMVTQKMDMGIISPKFRSKLPDKLSGRILPCVIVGDESSLSKTICDRYRFVRDIFLPNMRAYTCRKDGTIIVSKVLEGK